MNSSLAVLDDRRSAKTLAEALRSELQPGDRVATYRTYYQDLPVYIQREVLIVGWRGEAQFGPRLDGSDGSWILDEDAFWKEWNGQSTVYMFTDRRTYEELGRDGRHRHFLVAETDFDVLLSNRARLRAAAFQPARPHSGLSRARRVAAGVRRL